MNYGRIEQAATEAGKQFAQSLKKKLPVSLILGTVESVDEEAKTITAIVDDERVFSDISLDVFENGGNSVILVPKIGSLVIIGFIENMPEMPLIIKTTKVEKVILSNSQDESSSIIVNEDHLEVIRGSSRWILQNGQISLTADEVVVNGGDNGGVTLSAETAQKLAALEQAVNAIKQGISTFTSVYDGAAWTAFNAQLSGVLPITPITTQQDIANDSFKQ